jgi:hypothetical protein
VLLSSWDEPRWGVNARHTFAESLRWMDTVRDTARRTAKEGCGPDSPDFGGRVLAELGISPKASNPLTVRTFLAEME